MNIKDWLSRAYKIDQQLQSKREQIEVWRSLAQKLTSNPSDVRVSGGTAESKIENYCVKIADAEKKLEGQINKLIDTKREIEEAIALVPDATQRILLEHRFLLCKGWGQIAEVMIYDENYIRKVLFRRALEAIRPYIPQ